MWIYKKIHLEFTALAALFYAQYENAARQKIVSAFVSQKQITKLSDLYKTKIHQNEP